MKVRIEWMMNVDERKADPDAHKVNTGHPMLIVQGEMSRWSTTYNYYSHCTKRKARQGSLQILLLLRAPRGRNRSP